VSQTVENLQLMISVDYFGFVVEVGLCDSTRCRGEVVLLSSLCVRKGRWFFAGVEDDCATRAGTD
jgi:hypothetical protein